jgi:hypothetical protein
MIRWLAAAVALILLSCRVSFAHNLDEYLQAAIISVAANRVDVSMRLVPGVAVLPLILKSIDTDLDGVVSKDEWRAYARRLLADLTLTVDGTRLPAKLIDADFPTLAQMREGLGEIRIELSADVPPGRGTRKLTLENRHLGGISVYLVNCLVPRDRGIQILTQRRNPAQSLYELDYRQPASAVSAEAPRSSSYVALHNAVGELPQMFRVGMRHIAQGTDHLLFILTLLLPAPLLAGGARWAASAGVRHSLVEILKVVTAFTIGHSMTLGLGALGVVSVPSQPIEVLIAVSILVSAAHAVRPLFPGREAFIAAAFGLIHGLALAATLAGMELGRWERIGALLGFNLGIEAMQLIVVAATMPSLLLLSRTRAYVPIRLGGAFIAAVAATAWILQRLLEVRTPVDAIAGVVSTLGPWLAGLLFLAGLACWFLSAGGDDRTIGSLKT